MSVIKGWKFPIEIDKNTGKIMTIEDNDNVRQDVRIILETQVLERKTVPTFGSTIRSYMFEIIDPSFLSSIKSSIECALKNWEKHIKEVTVTVSASKGPISEVIVNIFYVTDILPVNEKFVYNFKTSGN